MSSEPNTPELAEAVIADHCHLRIPSLMEWIEPSVDYLVNRASLCGALHPNRSTKVMLALIEAVTNAVVHGNLGISSALKEQSGHEFADALAARCADPAYACRMVDIRASYDGSVLRWVITDQGAGFDVEAALRRLDEPPDLLRPSGRGLMMIRAFTDGMQFEDNGRRLTLLLRRQPDENRASPRWPFQQEVHVAPIGEDGQADLSRGGPALTRNISAGGIALLQTHIATQGRILVTIPTPSGEPVQIPASVRHWHALGDGVLEVGCRFEAAAPAEGIPPELEGVHALVETISQSQAAQAERRASVRLPYTRPVITVLDDGSEVAGFGRDLSRGGVAFLATRHLPASDVRLVLPQPSGEPIVVRARIVRCTHLAEEFHDVAARFLAG
jgi:anti-sigma regulatory factor (Ser/Thr protein kinase)